MSLQRPLLLVAVRHIQSEGNAAHEAESKGSPEEIIVLNRERHDTNYRGTDFGRWQGSITGEFLRLSYPTGFDRYYCSDTNRGKESAGIFGLKTPDQKEVHWDPLSLLRERDSREFSALTNEEKEETKKQLATALYDSPYYFHPFGEAPADLKDHRISPLLDRFSGRDINSMIWVCHGDFMRVLKARIWHFTKDDWKEMTEEYRQENEILNAALHIYSRQNPNSPSETRASYAWFRSICPWNTEHPSNSHHWEGNQRGWIEIKRKSHTNQGLLDSVAKFPQLVNRQTPPELEEKTPELLQRLKEFVC